MTYEQQSSFAGYDQSGLTPEELLARLIALQSKISSTMSEVNRTVSGVTEKQSQLTQTVDEISLNVLSIDTRLGTAEANLSVTAEAISSRVSWTDYNGEVIASLINQAADRITISAQAIDLAGAVTVLSDLSGNLGTITAGSINIDTTLTVGNTINIGTNANMGWTDWYLKFGNVANINVGMLSSTESLMSYNASNHTFNGSVTFNGQVNGNFVAKFG